MKRLLIIAIFSAFTMLSFGQSSIYFESWVIQNWKEVIRKADSIISKQDTCFENYYWKAYAQSEMGKELNAIVTMQTALDKTNDKSKVKSFLSKLYYEQGMYQEAVPLLDSIIKDSIFDFNLIQERTSMYEYYKQNLKAIDLLEKALKQDSLNSYYLIHLGENYLLAGKDSLAQKHLEIAYDLNPKDLVVSNKLASIYLKTNPQLAVNICDSVLVRDSVNIRMLQKAATASLKLEKESQALQYYQRALSAGDSTLNTLKNAGMLLQKDLQFYDARALLQKAYQQDTTSLNVTYYLALATSNSPDLDEAIALFKKAEGLITPDSTIFALIYQQEAQIYSFQSKYKEALDYYQKSLKYNPNNIAIHFYCAYQYQKLEEDELALKYYTFFLKNLEDRMIDKDIFNKSNAISLKLLAERNIKKLKEKLFFNGKLQQK